jgi:peptidoglycan hydrolase-like amidase
MHAYLKHVISSEMSAEAPIELLRAHAITSPIALGYYPDTHKALAPFDSNGHV